MQKKKKKCVPFHALIYLFFLYNDNKIRFIFFHPKTFMIFFSMNELEYLIIICSKHEIIISCMQYN